MITNILIVIFSIAGFCFLYYGFRKILTSPFLERDEKNLKQHLSVRELGLIEGSIKSLTEIIIIADKIEEPTNELYISVKENFKKGVKYIFLISKDKYHSEKNSYLRIFQGIADALRHNYKIENILEIHSLNFEWNGYPYVFYRYTEPDLQKPKAFAYMGTQQKEGIAEEYELINPTMALNMLELAFKGAIIPEHEKITKEELYDVQPKIIQINKAV